MEDLTTYTQVGSLTVTAAKVSGYFGGDVDRYLYKDFGVNHFDGISLNFEGLIEDSGLYGYTGSINMGFADQLDDAYNWPSGDISHIRVYFHRYGGYEPGTYWISIENHDDSWSYDSCSIDPDTVYYLTLTRLPGGDTATLKVYTDAARTSLYDTLSISSLGTEKWRYFYAASSFNDGDSSDVATGYYQNFEFLGKSAGQVRFIGMAM